MQTITAEEARSLSNGNNSEIQKRKKEFDKALEGCMVKIYNAAKAGSFRVECHCHLDLFNEINEKLNQFGYEVVLDLYLMSSQFFQDREQGIQTNMITFEVIWK